MKMNNTVFSVAVIVAFTVLIGLGTIFLIPDNQQQNSQENYLKAYESALKENKTFEENLHFNRDQVISVYDPTGRSLVALVFPDEIKEQTNDTALICRSLDSWAVHMRVRGLQGAVTPYTPVLFDYYQENCSE